MTALPMTDRAENRKLRIVHILRAPVGGLFRHVLDLAREQVARGHDVGIVADSLTGGSRAEALFGEIAPSLQLGLRRLPMRRDPHPLDLANGIRIAAHVAGLRPDIVHGHGSKGGLYARLPGFAGPLIPSWRAPVKAYTPHGGSFHKQANPLVTRLYMAVEGLLLLTTDVFLFESAYISKCFFENFSRTRNLTRVVPNGLSANEFEPVTPAPNAADFLYIGELRALKGIDTLIDALAVLAAKLGRTPRLVLVGSGPDEAALAEHAAKRGLSAAITFAGALPAREAFRLGRVLVVPSRAESLPYIVLEAAAARIPLVATDVGGIGEIFGPYKDRLIPCDDPQRLAIALEAMLGRAPADLDHDAELLAAFVMSKFKISDMADAVLLGYSEAIARRARSRNIAVQSLVQSG